MANRQLQQFESIMMRGDLCVIVRAAITHEVIRRIEIRNKITFLAADVMVELLAQRSTDANPTTNLIYSMRMGASNSPASRSDVNLGDTVIGKEILPVNKTTGIPGELQFMAVIESTEANGRTLQEAGLFTKGSAASPSTLDPAGTTPLTPRMFCRQIYPAITKTSSLTLEYSWRLAFTA